MELYQLRYFLAVARHENFHTAARESHVSVGSLAKAVQLLEDELEVALFQRVKRNIKLTEHGKALQSHALEILDRETAARIEVGRKSNQLDVVIAGQEILMVSTLENLEFRLQKAKMDLSLKILNRDHTSTYAALDSGEAQLGVVSGEPPRNYSSKKLFASTFKTVIGKRHKLFSRVKAGETIPIKEVLTFPFATINLALFGPVDRFQSLDGWRDDKFPRKIAYRIESLQLLISLIESGSAIAYLPDYFAEHVNLKVMNISGCPYTCKHEVYLIGRKPLHEKHLASLF